MSRSKDNIRIAKNTLLLYFRMLFLMFVTLYTSRIILKALGVEDFGIFSVVGGIVTVLAFFNAAMSGATQRFFAFELGKGDLKQLGKVFSAALSIHIAIALLVLILAETVGLWFFYNYLNIPPDRLDAGFWVYQFSIATFVVKIAQVPYNASIIAHERMGVYAYVSIAEAMLTLLLAFTLTWVEYDKLMLYAMLLFLLTLIIASIYKIYCTRKFVTCRYQFTWDRPLYEEIVRYSGWNLFGNLSFVAKGQGVNILLNIFFGPAINAARAIAYQLQTAVQAFVANFQMAVNPQIIKLYASEQKEAMQHLVFKSARLSYFLLFFLSLPILLETEFILHLWLTVVPEYSVIFTILIIINALVDSFSGPLMTSVQATGRIKWYQIVVGGMLLLNLPVSYVFLKLGYSPEITVYIGITLSLFALVLRLWFLQAMIGISIGRFFREVMGKALIVSFISGILPWYLSTTLDAGLIRFLVVGVASAMMVGGAIFAIGLTQNERTFIQQQLTRKFAKTNTE